MQASKPLKNWTKFEPVARIFECKNMFFFGGLMRSFFLLCLAVVLSPMAWAQTVATVGSKKITLQEFKQRLDEVKRQAINPPPPELFLEDLVRYEVGVQEAEKQKLQDDPIVKEQIRQAMYKVLVERAIGDKVNAIKVNDQELQKFYASNPELRTSHILIEVKPNATPEERAIAEKRAKEILAEVKKSKRPFEDLVKLYSDDSLSKNNGGDLGYQSKVTLVPTYYDAVQKMKVGDISNLIETNYGFHIVKFTGKRAYEQANKRQIRAAVFDEKRKEIFDNYFANLKKSYKIETNKSLVKDVK